MITANELVALHAETIGEGTICEYLASLGTREASAFRHDAEENRIVQIGEPVTVQGADGESFERHPLEVELSGEMLEAVANIITAGREK